MDSYIAVIFDSESQATLGLHKLWSLDWDGLITTHSTAVIRRNGGGQIEVASKSTHPGVRTAVGIGLGALIGALAGPIGVAAGVAGAATVVAGTAAGIGASAGGVVGLLGDVRKSAEHEDVAYNTGFVLGIGQSAVIAEVSESSTLPIDAAMKALGGSVYRRAKSDIQADVFFGDYGSYMYPYDYEPNFHY